MKKVLLKIAYDGTNYVGWQLQPNGTAVEEIINRELSALLKEEVVIAGASRTDSGVHAEGNIAVFDTETRIPADKICFALNQRLPADIVCLESLEVKGDFHPRRAVCTKTYEYRIYNAVHPDPLTRRYSYFVYMPLDLDAMRRAAEYLIGEHDFASFCSAHAQVKSTVRTIYSIEINGSAAAMGQAMRPEAAQGHKKYQANNISIIISGNGFLYNMVRIIVGTLCKVGYHFYPPEHMKEILEGCDRSLAGPKAPAEGLRLLDISYNPEDYCIAADSEDL